MNMDTATNTTPAIATPKPEPGVAYIAIIENEYRRAIQSSKDYLEHALKCGEALNAAKKEVGKKDWPEYRAKHFPGGDRTLRNWMRWAEPENRKKLEAENWKRVSKIANSDTGLTVREINEIVKKEPTAAQKAAAEIRKAKREAEKEMEKPKTLEEELLRIDADRLVDLLDDLRGDDFMNTVTELWTKRKAEDKLDFPAALDRRPELRRT